MSEPILRIEALRKRFGSFEALRGISFSLAPGETLGFLGRNGAGKSTTIKILCNLIRADSGEAWLQGQRIAGSRTAGGLASGVGYRRLIGAVVEAPRFYPQLSGRRNLAMIAELLGEDRARVDAMLARVDLSERAGVPFGQYSMGMKQRLGLAAAFLHRPPLVILDEPTNGLDPVGQRQVRALIRSLARDEGVSTLLCSHQLDEVGELCDRAVVIERGELILEQPLGDGPDGAGIAAVEACFRDLAGTATDELVRHGTAQPGGDA